jgi:hypothetical protein
MTAPAGARGAGRCRVLVARTQAALAERAQVARSLGARMVGLLGHRSLPAGEGMVLTACRSIHTAFMRFAIDAVFVDGRGRVVGIWRALPPWRVTPLVWGAQDVIELPAGTAERAGLAVGDQVVLEPVEAENALTTQERGR